jgi:peroxiredoxin Q/BCP
MFGRSILLCVAVLTAPCLAVAADAPEVGDKAPNFKLAASDGKTYELSQFLGKKPVVIAWFPKAFTGGCTAECKSMRENGEKIRKFDVAYFTASVDEVQKNTDFAKSLDLDYPILSDPTKETAKAFGVLNERGVSTRWTFYIDKEGVIRHIDKKVNTKEHGVDIAKKLEELGIAETK